MLNSSRLTTFFHLNNRIVDARYSVAPHRTAPHRNASHHIVINHSLLLYPTDRPTDLPPFRALYEFCSSVAAVAASAASSSSSSFTWKSFAIPLFSPPPPLLWMAGAAEQLEEESENEETFENVGSRAHFKCVCACKMFFFFFFFCIKTTTHDMKTRQDMKHCKFYSLARSLALFIAYRFNNWIAAAAAAAAAVRVSRQTVLEERNRYALIESCCCCCDCDA